MYCCQQCGAVVPSGTPRNVIVTKREVTHPYRRAVHKKIMIEKGKKVERWVDDPGGKGQQIVSEWAVCDYCMRLHSAK